MLFNRKDLDYTVVSEVIINGEEVLLLGNTVESMGVTVYQVVFNGGIMFNTLDVTVAERKFNNIVKDTLKRLTSLEVK